MRTAAGIVLIALGIVGLIGLVMSLSGIHVELPRYAYLILWRIGSAALLVIGGVFCLRRRYWRACLASALLALLIGASSTISYLSHIARDRIEPPWEGPISWTWGIWILLLGAVISAVFISLKRKEWQTS